MGYLQGFFLWFASTFAPRASYVGKADNGLLFIRRLA